MQLTGNVTLKNLSFGTKNYNGSTALTVTAGDLGALTAHQSLTSYYQKTETSSSTQLGTAFNNKVDLTTFNELSVKYDTLLTQLNEILTRINS